jgi:hypothetical protein
MMVAMKRLIVLVDRNAGIAAWARCWRASDQPGTRRPMTDTTNARLATLLERDHFAVGLRLTRASDLIEICVSGS